MWMKRYRGLCMKAANCHIRAYSRVFRKVKKVWSRFKLQTVSIYQIVEFLLFFFLIFFILYLKRVCDYIATKLNTLCLTSSSANLITELCRIRKTILVQSHTSISMNMAFYLIYDLMNLLISEDLSIKAMLKAEKKR